MTDQTAPGSLRVASPVDDADRRILAELGAGRLGALEDLYDRYRAMAFAIALRITADSTLAEDVVQDAFLGVWRHADRYVEGRGSVKTWLLSIVHHRAIEAGRLDAVEVRAALATLSDVQREAIELAYFGGLSQTEIAERMATPLGTVKSRMRLGLLAMRRALVGEGPDPMSEGVES